MNILRAFTALLLFASVAAGSTNLSADDLINQMQQFVEDNVDEGVLTELASPFLTSTNLNQLRLLEAATEKRIEQLNQNVAAKEKQLAMSEKQLVASRAMLTNIQQRINLLTLTPNQLEQVKEYNRTVTKDPSWFEMLVSRVTWFGIIITMITSFFFFFLGEWRQKVKEQRKRV